MARAALRFHRVDRVIDHMLFRLETGKTAHLLRHGRDSGERDACENNASYDTFHFEFLSNMKNTHLPDENTRRMMGTALTNAPAPAELTPMPHEGVSAYYA